MIEVVRDGILQADLVFFVVDSKEGVTRDDIEIASWLRSNFNFRYGSDRDEMLDQSSPIRMEGSSMHKTAIMPADEAKIKPEKPGKKKLLRLVANKADEEENLECMNDLYKLKMGDPIFVSAKQGLGLVASGHGARSLHRHRKRDRPGSANCVPAAEEKPQTQIRAAEGRAGRRDKERARATQARLRHRLAPLTQISGSKTSTWPMATPKTTATWTMTRT